jgi:hypothetical protein
MVEGFFLELLVRYWMDQLYVFVLLVQIGLRS